MSTEPYRCGPQNATKIWQWLQTRGGLLRWRSIDLSDPGAEWTTPAKSEDGTPVTKPHWKCDPTPFRHITDPAEVVVEIPKEYKRFRVGVRIGSNGLALKCTDASSRRIRNEVAKAASRQANGRAWYEFDYSTQEAVIYVSEKTTPIAEYIANHVA